jgi:hypothetical protein
VERIGEFGRKSFCLDPVLDDSVSISVVAAFTGIGIVVGIGFGIKRIYDEISWRRNATRLKALLITYITYNSSKTFEEIIEQREILVRIEAYAEMSQSPFAKHFLEKCSKNKYAHIKKGREEDFDEAFDLYQKLTNKGIANRDNYLKYGYPQKLEKDNGLGLKGIFLGAIDKAKNDFKKLPKEVTDKEETITTTTIIDGKETKKTEIKHTQVNNQAAPLFMQMNSINKFNQDSINY